MDQKSEFWIGVAYCIGLFLLAIAIIITFSNLIGIHIGLDPNVIVDRDISPSHHGALLGIVTTLPQDHDTYCIHAETLSRGEPVNIGVYYRDPVLISKDRFNSEEYENSGAGVFVTDNTHIVNESVTIPGNAIDRIVTVSYSYYTDENTVRLTVKRC